MTIMATRKKFTDQIRSAIEMAPVTRYVIAKETDISEAQLCRFLQGECWFSEDKLNTLAAYLRLKVSAEKKGR